MSDVPQKITPLLRMAIWEAHGRRCVYDAIPIGWDEVEIDHILPQSLWRDVTKKRQVFEILVLGDEFSPHDLSNLIPCRALRNGQKSDWVFEPGSVRFFRQLAEEKKTEVKRWMAKLSEQREQDRIRSEAEAACDANPPLKEKLLAALAATEPYNNEDYITTDRVRFARSRVLIDCFLPIDESYGSLLISINTLYLHRVQITLDARQILGSLLRGWGTPLELKQRGFIIGPRADQSNEWIVHIAGATMFLTTDELRQLCEVVDLLAPHFFKTLHAREIAEGTLSFAPDGPRNVRLLTIKRPLWAAILEFAREHDYEKGDSPWHIFDAGGHGHIKIVQRTPNGRIIPFEAYIYPASDESDADGPMTEPEDDVCLCWDASQSRLYDGAPGSSSIGWTAETTHHWLAEKLIPEVIGRFPREKPSLLDRFRQFVSSSKPPRYFSETEGIDSAIFRTIADWPAFTHFAGAAQVHYNSHPHDPVPRPVFESALSILSFLAGAVSVGSEHLGYFASKLSVPAIGDMRQLVVGAQRNYAAQAGFDGFNLDNILRCVGGVLRDHAPAAGIQPELFAQSSEALKPLAEAFRQEAIRNRTLSRIENHSTRA